MKILKTLKASLVARLILSIFISSSLAYGGSYGPVSGHKTPNVVEMPALVADSGGSGFANRGIDSLVNGDNGTATASSVVTGYQDKVDMHTETTSEIGRVFRTTHTAHPSCQDSCSL